MAAIALRTAASGLTALSTKLDVTANNLANINTAGFKASRVNFQDLLYLERAQPGTENANGDQRPIGEYVGLGVQVAGTQLDFSVGSPVAGNNLDVFIEGNGFFRVTVEPSLGEGGVAYTRSGQFTKNSNGELVLASNPGRRLEPNFAIPEEADVITVDANGTVSYSVNGQAASTELGQLLLSNFINPTGLKQVGENLFVETGASGPPIEGVPGTDNFGGLLQGYYEGSNVNPTRELIELITTQRAFEMNSQTIRTADETLQTVSQLRR